MSRIWNFGKGARAFLWSYYGAKAARLRANGNAAAADALIRDYDIPADRIPTLDAKGKRRGKRPHIKPTEELPPPKLEPINKQFARQRDRS